MIGIFLMKIIDLEVIKRKLGIDELIFINGENDLVRGLKTQSSNFLLGHSHLDKYRHSDDSLIANAEGCFGCCLGFLGEDEFLLVSPTHSDFFSADRVIAVLQVQQFSLKSSIDGATNGDCLTLIQTSRRFQAEDFRCHILDTWNS
jgi:hypothetical protein